MKIHIVATIAAALLSAAAYSQTRLEYKAGSNTPLRYHSHSNTESTQSMMGQEMKVKASTDQLLSITSMDSNGDIVYHITVDSGQTVVIMPNGDTNKVPSPILGKTRETKIKPDGQEVSTAWLDSNVAKTGSSALKELGSFFIKLPSNPVNVGDKWTDERNDTVSVGNGPGAIYVKSVSTYSYIGSQDYNGVSCARIQLDGVMTIKGTATIQGMDFDVDGSGKVSGLAIFDYANGRVVKVTGTANQSSVMSSKDQSMSIPIDQVSSYEISLVK